MKRFFESNKPVVAICHGLLLLTAYKLAFGKKLTFYIAVSPDLKAHDPDWVNQEVVVDGNLVTARAWPDNPAWMRGFIKMLKGQ